MKKRLLAIAMSLTMTLSLLPVSAFAGPMDETVENETEILAESVVNSVTEMEVGQSTTDVEQVESQQTTSAVAKVGDTEYATLEAAFEALSAKDHVLTLIDTGAWTYQNVYWQAGDQSGSADTLSAAVEAAHEVASAENIQIICKPETEIKDSNPHIDVTRSISIYANGADFAGDDLFPLEPIRLLKRTLQALTSMMRKTWLFGVSLPKDALMSGTSTLWIVPMTDGTS